jgi:hypothetical protein
VVEQSYQTADEPKNAWAGVWIAEDIELVAHGVQSGSWIDGTLGTIGAGLDALALVSDPVGALLQYGVAWIIEHVKPLSDALDRLAGDPAQIAAQARSWRNVAYNLREEADALARSVSWDTGDWTGAAGDAYRLRVHAQQQALQALAKASDTMALMTEGAGMLIGTVRMMVRDAIATAVSRLITYAGELVATAGLATPLVVEQVATLCASWAAKIAHWLRSLIASLRNLMREGSRLAELIEALTGRMGGHSKGGNGGLTSPSRPPDAGAKPSGRRTDAHPTRRPDRPLRRENESADAIARHGYDIEQNPTPKANGKAPDYRIDGEYFDCYAPQTANLDNIRNQVSGKVKEGQADRIVLNLDDCPRSSDEIADILRRKPIEGLKQILVVVDSQVTSFYPFE